MTRVAAQLPVGPDLVESIGQLAAVAGALVLLLLCVAFVGFVYKSVRGDGIEWPADVDRTDPGDGEGVERGDSDDEWKYY